MKKPLHCYLSRKALFILRRKAVYPSSRSWSRITGDCTTKVYSALELSKLKVRFLFRSMPKAKTLMLFIVLPPVPTAGLTAEDITPFSSRVRDQMLTALREISVKVPPSESAEQSDDRATPTPSAPSAPAEVAPSKEVPPPVPSKSEFTSSSDSQSLRKDGSETGTETEEDEGMVLVGRPT